MARTSTSWKPGQSGNPGGKPRRKIITDELTKQLVRRVRDGGPTVAQEAALTLIRLMLAGDVAATKLVMNYVEGLPVQSVEFGGPAGGPVPFTIHIERRELEPAGEDDGERDP